MIKLEDIHFSYNGRALLRGLNLCVEAGEVHGIIGPNGAGKSTLLRVISGLLRPQKGRVFLDNVELGQLSALERAKRLAFVFQENYTGFPLTVFDMVLLGRHPHQDRVLFDTARDRRIAEEALRMLDMDGFRRRLFRTLSGGEKQRVAIAAALAQKTPVILFDEPTAYTDIRYQTEIYRLIRKISREQRLTCIVVTHDVNLASIYCDKVSVLSGGALAVSGKPVEVLTEKLLQEVYHTGIRVIKHPLENAPLVIPVLQ